MFVEEKPRTLKRVSACCHDAVYHQFPINAHRLSDALSISCSSCGKRTHVVLLDEQGNVAWEADPIEEDSI